MNADLLLKHFDRMSEAPGAVPRLRQFILDLAVRGKLVEQDANEEPATRLLTRISKEREKFSNRKQLPPIQQDEAPFELPHGWIWVRIRQVTADRGQKTPTADFTYIDVTAINKEEGRIGETTTLTADEAPSRARKIVQSGDVLYSCVRPYLLNIAVVDRPMDPPPIASTAFAVLNGFGLVLSRFLWVVLRSPLMVSLVETKMRGQAYPAINDADFALLPMPLPPLPEQHRIVAKVKELMALCDQLEAAQAERERRRDRLAAASLHRLNHPADPADPELFRAHARFYINHLPRLTTRPDQIKQLRQSILNLAVCGKLVPQDPNDEPASELLRRIRVDRTRLGREPQLRSARALPDVETENPPFPIPPTWRWVRIHECFNVGGGIQKTPERTPKVNHFPYVGVSNVYRGKLELGEIRRFELFEGEIERYRLQVGDILVVEGNGSASEIGRCALWGGEIENCVHQNHIIRCRPFLQEITAYVLLYLNSPKGIHAMKALAITSSGLFSLSVGKIRTISIPLPPVSEQRRIVTSISELVALCCRLDARHSQNTFETKQLLEAVLFTGLTE